MSLLDRSRLEIKLGEYGTAPATALADPLLLSRVQDYRRQTAARMLPLDGGEVRKRLPAADYHVSRKVDGEFDVLIFDEGEALTLNPGGTVRVGLPALKEAAGQLKKAGVRKAQLAGELHFVRPDGKRPRVHDVTRASRTPDSQADLDGLNFAMFDIMDLNGDAPNPRYDAVWKQINDLFGSAKRCAPVESVVVKDAAEVEKQFKAWVGQGAEGAVVRSDAAGLFKIKPRHTIDAAVIGFTEGTDDRQGLLHDLLLALMRPDGTFHILGRVGGGFSEDDRRNFLSDLKDMVVESEYAEVNEQVAYQMVRPEWVIEISVLDLISESTRGAPINRMVLNWNAGDKRYQVIRRMPLVAPISPQFVRRRDDKTICPADLRLQQVADIVEVPLIDRDARQFSMSPSKVLRREVYTKEMKGELMVRKLVLWQTNKDQESDVYPAFVIHFTDFSPNRKTPLERDIRVSSSRDQMGELWKGLVEENIKKGWSLAGSGVPAETAAVPPAPVPVARPATPAPAPVAVQAAAVAVPAPANAPEEPAKKAPAKASRAKTPGAKADPAAEPAKKTTRKRPPPKG
jgi:hypothetical protein